MSERKFQSVAKRETLARRKVTTGGTRATAGAGSSVQHGVITGYVHTDTSGRTSRDAVIGTLGHFKDPSRRIAQAITEALDPTTAPRKPKTLADMTPEERAEIERTYGAKITGGSK